MREWHFLRIPAPCPHHVIGHPAPCPHFAVFMSTCRSDAVFGRSSRVKLGRIGEFGGTPFLRAPGRFHRVAGRYSLQAGFRLHTSGRERPPGRLHTLRRVTRCWTGEEPIVTRCWTSAGLLTFGVIPHPTPYLSLSVTVGTTGVRMQKICMGHFSIGVFRLHTCALSPATISLSVAGVGGRQLCGVCRDGPGAPEWPSGAI